MRNLRELLVLVRFLVVFCSKISKKADVEGMVVSFKSVINVIRNKNNFWIFGEYPKNYVSEDKAYELYRESVGEEVKNINLDVKKEKVLRLISEEYQIAGGRWNKKILASLPEASARDIISFDYNEETGDIKYSYVVHGSKIIPESSDGYRRARTIDTEGRASVTTNINCEEWLNKVVAKVLSGCASCREEWLVKNGYVVINRNSCGGSTDISYTAEKLYKELIKVNPEVADTFRCLYSEVFEKHNKEVLEKINTLEKEKEEVVKLYSDRKEDIELYDKYRDAITYTVERDRKGNGVVVFKRNDKIRFFDRGIKHPKVGDTIVILDEIELAKVKIIKDYIVIPDMDVLKKELVFRSSIKDNWRNPVVVERLYNTDVNRVLEKLDKVIDELKDTLI